MMKAIAFKTSLCYLSSLKVHYIELSPGIIKKLGGKINIRLICSINKKIEFQCGPVALGKGSAYITLNTQRMKTLNIKRGDTVDVSLKPDTSEYGMTIPEELKELLNQDPEGEKRFSALTPGKQRYIINYVATVKNSQLRIDRAILLIGNLKKLPLGKESFRGMLGLEDR